MKWIQFDVVVKILLILHMRFYENCMCHTPTVISPCVQYTASSQRNIYLCHLQVRSTVQRRGLSLWRDTKKLYEQCHRKFRKWCFSSFKFKHVWKLNDVISNTSSNMWYVSLTHSLTHTHNMQNCKIIMVCLVSVFNWISCIILYYIILSNHFVFYFFKCISPSSIIWSCMLVC